MYNNNFMWDYIYISEKGAEVLEKVFVKQETSRRGQMVEVEYKVRWNERLGGLQWEV